jgi:hypothetical protein
MRKLLPRSSHLSVAAIRTTTGEQCQRHQESAKESVESTKNRDNRNWTYSRHSPSRGKLSSLSVSRDAVETLRAC